MKSNQLKETLQALLAVALYVVALGLTEGIEQWL